MITMTDKNGKVIGRISNVGITATSTPQLVDDELSLTITDESHYGSRSLDELEGPSDSELEAIENADSLDDLLDELDFDDFLKWLI
mgnify:CR=1 FL=1